MNNSERRIAVVTGASKGIGRTIATRLAADGCDVVLVARDASTLREAAAFIAKNSGRRAEICATDLSTAAGCLAVQEVTERLPGVDILVNCAGAARGGPFLQLEDAAWGDGFALKFHAAVRLSRLLWPALKQRAGIVINIAGAAARVPSADFMVGGAVNAALANFSKALAELGLKDNVNVNTIHPGMTATERLEAIFATRAEASGVSVEALKRQQIEKDGVRRLGEPRDVASLVSFLCSVEARHINGAAIPVDGGAVRALF